MNGHPLPRASATPHDDEEAGYASLFRTLADGRRHALADLAASDMRTVLDDLAALRSFGLSMDLDATSVRTTRCTPLDADTIARALERDGRHRSRAPWTARVAFEVASTNTALLGQVRRDDGEGTPCLLAAEVQHAGRGRLGREWSSVPGASLTASFACPVARRIAGLDGVTLVCGLAVQGVVASLGLPVQLKWPNDLLLDGRKLGGILVELHTTSIATVLVIGIGLNVAFTPASFAPRPALPAASLRAAGSAPLDRNRLIAELASSLEAHLALFEVEGFPAFVDAWNAVDAYVDRPVRLESPPAQPMSGIARGVDEGGALLLEVDGQRRRIIVGDVSLRPVVVDPA